MSGGYFDYRDSQLYEWSRQVRQDGNPLLADLLHDIGKLLHEYDLWMSADSNRDRWLKAWESWQKKWIGSNPTELAVDAVKDTVRQMIWESLGKPADEEYDRIEEKMRGW